MPKYSGLLMIVVLFQTLFAEASLADQTEAAMDNGSWVSVGYERARAYYDEGNYSAALAEVRPSVEQGEDWAQYLLGLMYATGRGVDKDEALAVSLYTKAAEQGYARGQSTLGYVYEVGRGVDKDEALAVSWYTKAAEQGYALAQTNLGDMYRTGQVEIEFVLDCYEICQQKKKDALAVFWYTKSAEQGGARAQNTLGYMYESGRGVDKDEALAVSWYRKAAEQGYALAQSNLGRMYESGRGVDKDEALAVSWYRKAAEQGSANGQTRLGNMYESGSGVDKDEALAVSWYRKAAEQGSAKAEGKANELEKMIAVRSEEQQQKAENQKRLAIYKSHRKNNNENSKIINAIKFALVADGADYHSSSKSIEEQNYSYDSCVYSYWDSEDQIRQLDFNKINWNSGVIRNKRNRVFIDQIDSYMDFSCEGDCRTSFIFSMETRSTSMTFTAAADISRTKKALGDIKKQCKGYESPY
ncbi:sel1 repeat family protein [Luminiphilus sp.]|nr:sel1 repeat family protein [Luminiphilus sp.]